MDSAAVASEQAVLGALMLDNAAWPAIASRLDATDFCRRDHQVIFGAIAELRGAGNPADAVTLAEHLERRGLAEQAGGLIYLAGLVRDTPGAANVLAYAGAVRERATLRQLQDLGRRIAASDGGGEATAHLLAAAMTSLAGLQQRSRQGTGLVAVRQLAADLIDDLDRRRAGPVGLRIGLDDFDEATMGLEPGDLVVYAGRPGMGKTALLVQVAANVSQSQGVAVFSAEMPAAQLMRRCVANLSDIPQGMLRRADRMAGEHWAALSPALQQAAARRLWIDDTAAPTLAHIRGEISSLHARQRLGLAIVDYVQLVRGHGANRYEQLRDVAYGLKALAKDAGIPIILLAQLNRGVEARDQKRPHISDLRDSGAIEEAADIIGLLYSEGYYDPEFSMGYVLECALAKNRNGERAECFWHFNGAHSRVTVLNDGARAQYRQLRARQRQQRSAGADL